MAARKPKKPVRKVIAKEEIANDLELHVVRTAVDTGDGGSLITIEIRNFIPSLGEYGRGVTFPAQTGKRISKAVDLCSL